MHLFSLRKREVNNIIPGQPLTLRTPHCSTSVGHIRMLILQQSTSDICATSEHFSVSVGTQFHLCADIFGPPPSMLQELLGGRVKVLEVA